MLSRVIFTLALVPGLASPQNPAPAQLRGRITDAVTHQPIPKVHIGGTFAGRFVGTLTGPDGSYALEDLSPGEAALTINLDNYRMVFGPRDPQAAFTLAPGESATRNFELHPLGRIYGKITDHDSGLPIEDHAITALRLQSVPGHLIYAGRPVTSARGGTFDVRDLEPGDYLVGIESLEEPKILAEAAKTHPKKLYGPRWYPNVPRRDMATVIHIAEGESRQIDLTFEARERHTLSGSFEVPPEWAGRPVSLRLDSDIGNGIERMVELPAGPFRVEDLTPAPYHLVFTAGEKFEDLIGLRKDDAVADYDFEITDHDIEAAHIVLQAGAGVAGTVRMIEDDVPLPPKVTVSMLGTSGWFARLPDGGAIASGIVMMRATPMEVGRFHQEPLRPGRYWPMINLPDGYAVAQVLFVGAKSRYDPITLTALNTPLDIVLTAHPGSIAGTVEAKRKSTVILLPDPIPAEPSPDAIRFTETGPEGAFLFSSLAPGTYRAVALSGDDLAHQGDLAWLTQRLAQTDPIEVRPTQPTTVTLR
jgi:hypothetical protein